MSYCNPDDMLCRSQQVLSFLEETESWDSTKDTVILSDEAVQGQRAIYGFIKDMIKEARKQIEKQS